MNTISVLVVADELGVRRRMNDVLRSMGNAATFAATAKEGLWLLERKPFRVLFVDEDMADVEDEWLRGAIRIQPCLTVAVLTKAASLAGKRRKISVAGEDYLPKPPTRESVRAVLARILNPQAPGGDAGRPSRSCAAGPRPEPVTESGLPVIARSAAMRQIVQQIAKVAATDAPILICGEFGVGKSSLAGHIHRSSARAQGPLVRIACGAIREGELEATLFAAEPRHARGHEDRSSPLLQASCGGTLFLKGIDQLPSWTQVRLLDALQSDAHEAPGYGGDATPNFRVVASFQGDPQTALANGSLDPKLYYYLSVVVLHVPPLRHRREDIRALAEHFLAAATALRDCSRKDVPWRFSAAAWDCLLRYDWPGNAPQLANVVTHAVILAEEAEIGEACLRSLLGPSPVAHDSETISLPLSGSLKEMERRIIDDIVERFQGNKTAAAQALGLHRRTLYRMLAEEERRQARAKTA
jgi:two-component system response regulator HydG